MMFLLKLEQCNLKQRRQGKVDGEKTSKYLAETNMYEKTCRKTFFLQLDKGITMGKWWEMRPERETSQIQRPFCAKQKEFDFI